MTSKRPGSDIGWVQELAEHPDPPSPLADWIALSRAMAAAERAKPEDREPHFAAAYVAAGENFSARAMIESLKRDLGIATAAE